MILTSFSLERASDGVLFCIETSSAHEGEGDFDLLHGRINAILYSSFLPRGSSGILFTVPGFKVGWRCAALRRITPISDISSKRFCLFRYSVVIIYYLCLPPILAGDKIPSKVCLVSPGTDLPGEWALLALGSFPGLLRHTLDRFNWPSRMRFLI